MDKKRRNAFLEKVKEDGPQSFAAALDAYFPDAKTQRRIFNAFTRLGLPLPQSTDDFMPGTDGCLVFSNAYGLVIRIEEKEKNPVRTSQWVLQPLGVVDAGDAVVEFCPACMFEDKKANYKFVKTALAKEGINFWDTGLRNMGRLPIVTPKFPEGIPVVVDRRAVKMISDEVRRVRRGLQGPHYRPLRAAFTAAARSKAKGADFLNLCAEFVTDGRLVAGWNDYHPLVDNQWEGNKAKGLIAGRKAAAYDALLPPQARPAVAVAQKSAKF